MIILINEASKISRVLSNNEEKIMLHWMQRIVKYYDADLVPYTKEEAEALDRVLALYLESWEDKKGEIRISRELTTLDRAEFSAMKEQAEELQEEGLTFYESWIQAKADLDGDFMLDRVDRLYRLFMKLGL